jgi:phytoene desaturase (3,4-didehydrolycopene-forming)
MVKGLILTLVCATSSFHQRIANPRKQQQWSSTQWSSTQKSRGHRHSDEASTPVADLPRVVVVGGGVGGLAVASRIASSLPSCQVTILEKNAQAGGRCGSFDVSTEFGTFRHERGPSLLLLPDTYRQLFQDIGRGSAEDYGLIMESCVPAYRAFFEDGDMIELGFPRKEDDARSEAELESRRKMDSYEMDGSIKWDSYMRACAAFLVCGLPNFIEERLDLPSFPAFLVEALRDFAKAWPLKPHSDVLDTFFTSDKMKALASFQDLYVGLEPYRNENLFAGGVLETTAPAVFGLLAAIELHPTNDKSGVFAPIGGFRTVFQSLERLAKDLGVDIQCNTTVTNIQENGVFCSNKFIPADLVIVNADLPYATRSLIDQPHHQTTARYDWEDKYRFSSGVIAFHWSVTKELGDLDTHNVFLSANNRSRAEQSWETLRNSSSKPSFFASTDTPFNFYVHRASKTDRSAAPKEMDAIMVLVPTETLLRCEQYASLPRNEALQKYQQQFDEPLISRVREAVLRRMASVSSLHDLKSCIVHEVVDTPATFAAQYNVAAGTPFALSHGLAQLSLARPGPDSSRFSNVLFCGASSRPGNGVPLVLTGAKLVAERAVKQLKNSR